MRELHQALLAWYEVEGRHDLLWRNTDDIYSIYLSEIMLQQTQVSRVEELFYPHFLEHFPTLSILAAADIHEVLSKWSGLGYYSRARNLHATAKLCSHGLPRTYHELIALPGIGDYTARAICAFGYNEVISVIDTNIARVLKRTFALESPTPKILLEYADRLLNHEKPRDHNLALMDLGSLVCLPQNPLCTQCPLQPHCQGEANPTLYTQIKKTQYLPKELSYGILIQAKKIALVKTTGSMYKGMLELPTIPHTDREPLATFKHTYTKYRLTINLHEIESFDESQIIWVEIKEANNYPISTLTKKALNALHKAKM